MRRLWAHRARIDWRFLIPALVLLALVLNGAALIAASLPQPTGLACESHGHHHEELICEDHAPAMHSTPPPLSRAYRRPYRDTLGIRLLATAIFHPPQVW